MCNGYFTRFLITNNYSYYLGVDISETINRFDRSPIANQSLRTMWKWRRTWIEPHRIEKCALDRHSVDRCHLGNVKAKQNHLMVNDSQQHCSSILTTQFENLEIWIREKEIKDVLDWFKLEYFKIVI